MHFRGTCPGSNILALICLGFNAISKTRQHCLKFIYNVDSQIQYVWIEGLSFNKAESYLKHTYCYFYYRKCYCHWQINLNCLAYWIYVFCIHIHHISLLSSLLVLSTIKRLSYCFLPYECVLPTSWQFVLCRVSWAMCLLSVCAFYLITVCLGSRLHNKQPYCVYPSQRLSLFNTGLTNLNAGDCFFESLKTQSLVFHFRLWNPQYIQLLVFLNSM